MSVSTLPNTKLQQEQSPGLYEFEATLTLSEFYDGDLKIFRSPKLKVDIDYPRQSATVEKAIKQIKQWIEEIPLCR